jgi:hypothetical protein
MHGAYDYGCGGDGDDGAAFLGVADSRGVVQG